ncbi:MAG: 50S ribosomal protein L20 [uncultured bacterium]|nr:MAG: 50S ribosomal protein L20 [uncultured bacterium]HLD43842.1 50S ribosomal protein L20 [bacterium]
MARAKRGFKARRRRKAVLSKAKGYRGGQSKLFRTAAEKVRRAEKFSYRDRKVKKRNFRSLWIVRISAAVKELGLSYSRFINGLKLVGSELDRKALSQLAITQPKAFAKLVDQVKTKIAA